MSNNQYKKNPKEISLKSLEEILDIISLIESDGIFFGKSKNENLSALSENKKFAIYTNIQNMLYYIIILLKITIY